MGLDLIPTHDPCQELERVRTLEGVTVSVSSDFRCPLAGASKHQGMFGTDCWCRGKAAARELEALGYSEDASKMFEDYSSEGAIEQGRRLIAVCQVLRDKFADAADKPGGARWNGWWNEKTNAFEWQDQTSFDEALAVIEDAGRWYVTVGEHGSGVRAWY